ncbi:MAG TPA: serine hydrolase domain-containing protein [Egicoccus sp.]|nr:serine hydrolase domain-containing protein [Egicoccus sp.]HSK24577.1 serine hydrolase domain-containing protein [Egicoccus sp.]
MPTIPEDLAARLARFLADTDCPGAQLGVLVDGEIHVESAGVLNLDTGVEVTDESVFQIGSATKVWTATLVMQLIDEGQLTLDTRVADVLPGFRLGDPATTAGLTVRHLLTHTSGIEGDVFDDFGTNDDCVARYVEGLADQDALHELGETWSYCNSGWVLLGRVVEVLTAGSWDDAVKQRLGKPLGLERLCTLATEAILHRASVGHVKPPEAESYVVAPEWSLPRALGPAGLITTTVHDLLRFGRMHLEEGKSDAGEQVLSAQNTALMQQHHADCPERHLLADAWGLGWMLDEQDGGTLIGHGGNTIGQSTYFYLAPDAGVGVALLTNITGGSVEARALLDALLRELAGVGLPPQPEPADGALDLDLDRLAGTYRRHGVETIIERSDGALHAEITMSGPMVETMGISTVEMELLPAARDGDDRVVFVGRHPLAAGLGWVPVTFYGDAGDGRPRFMHTGARASVRAD